jgi:hypothetical protein
MEEVAQQAAYQLGKIKADNLKSFFGSIKLLVQNLGDFEVEAFAFSLAVFISLDDSSKIQVINIQYQENESGKPCMLINVPTWGLKENRTIYTDFCEKPIVLQDELDYITSILATFAESNLN